MDGCGNSSVVKVGLAKLYCLSTVVNNHTTCISIAIVTTSGILYKQEYRRTLYLAVCSKNAVDRISNWLISLITVCRETHACSINGSVIV